MQMQTYQNLNWNFTNGAADFVLLQAVQMDSGTTANQKCDLFKSLEALNLTCNSEKTDILAQTANLQWSEKWQWSTTE